jgi:hypothetical protein
LGGTINLAGGNLTVKEADEVTIGGNLLLNGGNLDITGEKTINILNQATVSTRRIALLADQLSDNNSIGNSGNITLRGSDITIGANVNLLAQASGYQAGNITIKAASTKDFLNYLSDFGLGLPGVFKLPGSEYKANISLGQNAILKGQDITLTAEAGGNKGDTNMIKEYAGTALRTITNFIVNLPVMVKVINTSATVEVASQSQIISSGDVKIQTNAVADSSLSVSSGDGALVAALSIGLSVAKTSSKTILNDGVKIESAKSVDILSDAKSTAATKSATKRNLGEKPKNADAIATSFAVAYSNAISYATVNQNVAITAKGNINVRATGNSVNKTSATAGIYEDGTVGFTVAVGVSDSDIKADVNGNLTAGAADLVKSFDLDSARTKESRFGVRSDGTTYPIVDLIVFPTAHSLNTGNALVYTKGDESNQEIEGLRDGETYYVIVVDLVDLQTIKLARTLALAEAGVAIELDTSKKTGQGHKLVDGTKTNGIGIVAELESTDTAAASSGIEATPTTETKIFNGIINGDVSAVISAGQSSKLAKDIFEKDDNVNKKEKD